MSLSLTRHDFDVACNAYIREHQSSSNAFDAQRYPHGWIWEEHASLPNFGYMSRSVLLPLKSAACPGDDTEESDHDSLVELDDGAAVTQSMGVLTSRQYVVYSPTFRVPVFHFTLHDSSGSPLALTDIVTSPMFRRHALPETVLSSFAMTMPDAPFPMLSQGEHPTLGTPSWYFHPCHTPEAIAEVMTEVQEDDWTTELRLLRWMEAWLMVVGHVVDFGAGCL